LNIWQNQLHCSEKNQEVTMKIGRLFAAALFLIACARDKAPFSPSDDLVIAYGASFGECRGYCSDSLKIVNGTVFFTNMANDERPDLTASAYLSEAQQTAFSSAVRWQEFLKLPEVIGCPDCADGGAEWIEISYPSASKRVTFEFGAELAGHQELVSQLRGLRVFMKSQIGGLGL
jgi:hypothetical protein